MQILIASTGLVSRIIYIMFEVLFLHFEEHFILSYICLSLRIGNWYENRRTIVNVPCLYKVRKKYYNDTREVYEER